MNEMEMRKREVEERIAIASMSGVVAELNDEQKRIINNYIEGNISKEEFRKAIVNAAKL